MQVSTGVTVREHERATVRTYPALDAFYDDPQREPEVAGVTVGALELAVSVDHWRRIGGRAFAIEALTQVSR